MKLLREYIRSLLIETAIGQCYPHVVKMAKDSSQEEFSDLARFKVVHGRVTDKYSGESVLHAWVEKGGMVFDWQTHSTKPDGIPKDVYYDMHSPEIHNEYTAEETMVNCLKSGQAGPWTMQESVLLESNKAAEIRDYYGIDLWMKGPYGGDQYEPDIVEIESLVVPEEKRGQGIATDVMFELVRWADSNGYVLALDPSSDFGSSVSRLRKFYSQFGFSGNKGRKKDYRTRYAMIRYPKNKVLKEEVQGSKGSLVVVDIQPEYESGTPFDIGNMLRTAADSYSRVLFLYNGPDLGMIDESGLKNFYFEKLDYDEEAFDELLSKSEFFDKGYGFFRDVMDSDLCFDRSSVIKIVKYMIDNDYRDIRELEEEDVEAIGVSELLFDDLEDYGFYIPDLEEVLPNWSGSDIAGGARNECLAEVEILGAAQGLSFRQVGRFIYEGDNRYTDKLNEATERALVTINGMPMEVELASDNKTRSKGLMHRESLPYDTGMLFVFPDAAERSFHMRDTHVPLSIAFADGNGEIKTVKDMFPYDEESVTSDCDAAYALEVNQGYFDDNGITVGDIINIER